MLSSISNHPAVRVLKIMLKTITIVKGNATVDLYNLLAVFVQPYMRVRTYVDVDSHVIHSATATST